MLYIFMEIFSAFDFNKILFIELIFNAPQPRTMKWLLLFFSDFELHVTSTVNFT